ncbi:MAG: hypothetical protein Q9170_002360 [Blastenia crenularia]
MGQHISQVIESIKDPAVQGTAEDLLNAVMEVARKELELHYSRLVDGNYDKRLIEIDKVLSKDSFIYALASDRPVTATDTVKDVGQRLVSGRAAEGLGKIIDEAFATFSSEQHARSQTKEIYAAAIDDLGTINRLDIVVFQYNFASKGLITETKGVVACLVVKSTIKTEGLSDYYLRVIVDQNYGRSSNGEKMAVFKELQDAWQRNL